MLSQYMHQGHQRSFSFTSWDEKDYSLKTQPRFYYNYSQSHNPSQKHNKNHSFSSHNGYNHKPRNYDSREEAPTFGGNARRPQFEHYRKPLDQYQNQPKNYDSFMRYQPNYSLDNKDFQRSYARNNKQFASINNYKFYDANSSFQNSKACRIQLQKATEKKMSNIDKINDKIKKILRTLNDEQKKITEQQNYRVVNKKMSSNNYANRIKTQGDEIYQYEKQNHSQIYGRLLGIKQRYQQKGQPLYSRNLNTNFNANIQIKKNQENCLQLSYKNDKQNRYLETMVDQIKPITKEQKVIDIDGYKYQKENKRQYYKVGMQNTYKFLKGTNVKSTDSLNLASSTYFRKQRQSHQNQKDEYQRKANNNSSPYARIEGKQNIDQNQKQRHYQYGLAKTSEDFKIGRDGSKGKEKLYKYDNLYPNEQYIQKNNNMGINIKSGETIKDWSYQIQIREPMPFKERSNDIQIYSNKIERTPNKQRNDKSSILDKSEKSCKLSNGKDVDLQIEKIQKKINDFENIKKSLNIQDEQHTKKSRSLLNRSLSKYRQMKSGGNLDNRSSFTYSNEKYEATPKVNQNLRSVAQFHSISFDFSQKNDRNQYHHIRNDNTEVEVCLPKPFKMCSKKNTKRNVGNSGINQIESAFMSQQRNSAKDNKQSIKNLIRLLCQQIQLDTNFRNLKKWFSRKPNQHKWRQLSNELAKYKISTNEQQNRDVFTLTEQQDNPFYTSRDEQGSYDKLVKSFIQTEKYWIQNIQQQFHRQEVERSLSGMDIDRKGRITIQDFVRYVNLQSDQYYRNRDLSIIFRRLSQQNKQVSIQQMLAQFCRQ